MRYLEGILPLRSGIAVVVVFLSDWKQFVSGEKEVQSSPPQGFPVVMSVLLGGAVLLLVCALLGPMAKKVIENVKAGKYLKVTRLLKGSKYRESGYGDVIALDARLTCIIKALQDSDPEIRKGAIWALGYHATMNSLPEPAVAALTDVLRNRHEDICIRKNASWTLGIHLKKMPLAENTMNALIDSLDDRAAIIRTNAVSFIETHIQKSHIKLAFTSHEYLNEARYRPLNRMEIGLIKRGLSAEERAAV